MEKTINKVFYILIAIILLCISNYLVIGEIFDNFINPEVIKFDNNTATKVPAVLTEEYGLYNKYELDSSNLNPDSQEWYKTVLKSDCVIKFQYYNKDNQISKLNLYINDIKIMNEEEFYKEDKFNFNFYIFGDILVIEHLKEGNRLPYIKIMDLTTGETRNLSNREDFYINDVNVSNKGIEILYSRQQQTLENYINSNTVEIPFTVEGKEVIIDICDKKSWTKELYDLEYVSFTMTYEFTNNELTLNGAAINNLVKFEAYIKPYTKDFKKVCSLR